MATKKMPIKGKKALIASSPIVADISKSEQVICFQEEINCVKIETMVLPGDIMSFRITFEDSVQTIVGIPFTLIEFK